VSVGKSPLKAITVNPGRHRISASKEGRTSASKTIEVASFDTVNVTLDLPETAKPNETTPPPLPTVSAAPTVTASATSTTPPPPPPKSIPWAGWVVTGMAAIGAGVTGGLALSKNGELAEMRKPDSGATKQQLSDTASSTATLALVSDILTGAAVISGVVTLYFTVRDPPAATTPKKEGALRELKLGVAPGGLELRGTF